MNSSSRRGELPPFSFETVDLHLDPPVEWNEIYQSVTPSNKVGQLLGTRIWWASPYMGPPRCLKEFFVAPPDRFGRQLPDPAWQQNDFPPSLPPSGAQRGLFAERAQLYDALHTGSLRQELMSLNDPTQHTGFYSQFNAYSFEIEALVTQFAQYHGCNRLVPAYTWGPVFLPGGEGYRNVLEMERLGELAPPPAGSYLEIVDRLLEMMAAVHQLHSMLIPLRCYPPELVRDLDVAARRPATRPFHYDLSPEQFLRRPGLDGRPDQIILIDFNSSRMAQTQYSSFSWLTIPGKDFYQTRERRSQSDLEISSEPVSHRSHPLFDLYSLMIIAFFYLLRESDQQQNLKEVLLPLGVRSAEDFYLFLARPDLNTFLQERIPPHQGIEVEPLIALLCATLQQDPEQRLYDLLQLPELGWQGEEDWMLVPRAMDYLARHVLGRSFEAAWRSGEFFLEEGHPPQPLSGFLDPSRCSWQQGPYEPGRISAPPFSLHDLFFFQAESTYPVVRKGRLEPGHAGAYTLYASFGGCVDLLHPLRLQVREAITLEQHTPSFSSAPASSTGTVAYVPAATSHSLPPSPEATASPPQEESPSDRTESPLAAGALPLDDLHGPTIAMSQEALLSGLPAPPGTTSFSREEPQHSSSGDQERPAESTSVQTASPSYPPLYNGEEAATPSPSYPPLYNGEEAATPLPSSPYGGLSGPEAYPSPEEVPPGPGTVAHNREWPSSGDPVWVELPIPPPQEQPAVSPTTPPPARTNTGSPSSATHAFSREDPPFTPLPLGVEPAPRAFAREDPPFTPLPLGVKPGTRAFSREDPSQKTPPPGHPEPSPEAPLSSFSLVQGLPRLLREVASCNKSSRLEELERAALTQLSNHREEASLLLLNVRVRRCQLQQENRSLHHDAPVLKSLFQLSELFEDLPQRNQLALGLLFNNLAVCYYESLLRAEKILLSPAALPFDPYKALQQWVLRSDPEGQEVPPRYWEVWGRARETLEYCRKIRKLVGE